jgi:hypothetical protein
MDPDGRASCAFDRRLVASLVRPELFHSILRPIIGYLRFSCAIVLRILGPGRIMAAESSQPGVGLDNLHQACPSGGPPGREAAIGSLGVPARQPCRREHDGPAGAPPTKEMLLRGDPLDPPLRLKIAQLGIILT